MVTTSRSLKFEEPDIFPDKDPSRFCFQLEIVGTPRGAESTFLDWPADLNWPSTSNFWLPKPNQEELAPTVLWPTLLFLPWVFCWVRRCRSWASAAAFSIACCFSACRSSTLRWRDSSWARCFSRRCFSWASRSSLAAFAIACRFSDSRWRASSWALCFVRRCSWAWRASIVAFNFRSSACRCRFLSSSCCRARRSSSRVFRASAAAISIALRSSVLRWRASSWLCCLARLNSLKASSLARLSFSFTWRARSSVSRRLASSWACSLANCSLSWAFALATSSFSFTCRARSSISRRFASSWACSLANFSRSWACILATRSFSWTFWTRSSTSRWRATSWALFFATLSCSCAWRTSAAAFEIAMRSSTCRWRASFCACSLAKLSSLCASNRSSRSCSCACFIAASFCFFFSSSKTSAFFDTATSSFLFWSVSARFFKLLSISLRSGVRFVLNKFISDTSEKTALSFSVDSSGTFGKAIFGRLIFRGSITGKLTFGRFTLIGIGGTFGWGGPSRSSRGRLTFETTISGRFILGSLISISSCCKEGGGGVLGGTGGCFWSPPVTSSKTSCNSLTARLGNAVTSSTTSRIFCFVSSAALVTAFLVESTTRPGVALISATASLAATFAASAALSGICAIVSAVSCTFLWAAADTLEGILTTSFTVSCVFCSITLPTLEGIALTSETAESAADCADDTMDKPKLATSSTVSCAFCSIAFVTLEGMALSSEIAELATDCAKLVIDTLTVVVALPSVRRSNCEIAESDLAPKNVAPPNNPPTTSGGASGGTESSKSGRCRFANVPIAAPAMKPPTAVAKFSLLRKVSSMSSCSALILCSLLAIVCWKEDASIWPDANISRVSLASSTTSASMRDSSDLVRAALAALKAAPTFPPRDSFFFSRNSWAVFSAASASVVMSSISISFSSSPSFGGGVMKRCPNLLTREDRKQVRWVFPIRAGRNAS